MQTDATSANNFQHCWVLLANSVASIWHGHKSLTCFKLYATNTNIVVVPCKRRCIFSNFRNENFKNFPYPLDFACSAKLPPPPPQNVCPATALCSVQSSHKGYMAQGVSSHLNRSSSDYERSGPQCQSLVPIGP